MFFMIFMDLHALSWNKESQYITSTWSDCVLFYLQYVIMIQLASDQYRPKATTSFVHVNCPYCSGRIASDFQSISYGFEPQLGRRKDYVLCHKWPPPMFQLEKWHVTCKEWLLNLET